MSGSIAAARQRTGMACRSLAGPLDPRLQWSVSDEELDRDLERAEGNPLASLRLFIFCCVPMSALSPEARLAPAPLITSRYEMGNSSSRCGKLVMIHLDCFESGLHFSLENVWTEILSKFWLVDRSLQYCSFTVGRTHKWHKYTVPC